MRLVPVAAALLAGYVLASCAYVPSADAPLRPTSPDYMTSGGVNDVRAYLYGERTVLQFTNAPVLLIVKDEKNASVDFERIGRHVRLGRRLNYFTIWVNGRAAAFSFRESPRTTTPATSPSPLQTEPVALTTPEKTAESTIAAQSSSDADLSALLAFSGKLLQEVRQLIETASQNQRATGAELYAANMKLDEIESRVASHPSVLIYVTFDRGSTDLAPIPELASALISVAKVAEQISLRGRTDARVAGPADPGIAFGRAMAVRKYLTDNGIDPSRIKVSSQGDGDFLAPNSTREGKSRNRRVEIEIFDSRIARLRPEVLASH